MTNLTKTVFGDAEEIFIDEKGFVYYPLLLDKSIVREAKKCREIKNIGGKTYVKGMNLSKIAGSFDKIDKEKYETIKNDLFKRIMPEIDLKKIYETIEYGTLKTIIFEVMPYFLEKNKKRNPFEKKKEKKLTEKDILGLINENAKIPKEYYNQAKNIYRFDDSEKTLDKIKMQELKTAQKFPEGIVWTKTLETVLKRALENGILNERIKGMKEEIRLKEEIFKKSLDYAATMLYLKDAKDFELENFGFIRKSKNDYVAYIKTEEYALRDFDGKVYLFPPCKVGVHTDNYCDQKPIVLNRYGHPFLPYSGENQYICIGNAKIRGKGLGETMISALEKGINAMLFGYLGNDNPHHHELRNFSHLRISANSAKIKSGKVKITNDPFIKSNRRRWGD